MHIYTSEILHDLRAGYTVRQIMDRFDVAKSTAYRIARMNGARRSCSKEMREKRWVLAITLLIQIGWTGAAKAAGYQQIVQFECDPALGTAYVKLYFLEETLPHPDNDIRFSNLATNSHGLICALSPQYIVTIHALASERTPSHDNLEVSINGEKEADLSITGPLADPSQNYTESVTIRKTAYGKLRTIETIAHDAD